MINYFITSADHQRHTQQVCCLVPRLCHTQGKSKPLHMKIYIFRVPDPWGINRKCLQTWVFFPPGASREEDSRELVADERPHLDLDLVCELQQVPRQLLAVKVSSSEHHLQPRASSGPRRYRHAEVVLRLELHVGLKQRDGVITMAQTEGLNQKESQGRKRGPDRGWWGWWGTGF